MTAPGDAPAPALDLGGYRARIAFAGPATPTLETLAALHERHAGAIPFENLDVRLGRPILLDLASVQRKLVAARRGGYCFEQNALFAAVLGALGYVVETLEARVLPASPGVATPRTHMLLRVLLGGRAWLADVGFGGDGPLRPVPLDGEAVEQPGGAYRVETSDGRSVLRLFRKGAWSGLYAFGPEPALPIDYAVANHYTSTHPSSSFVRTPTVQLSRPDARHTLRGRTYAIRRGDAEEVRELGLDEIVRLLPERFGLHLPEEDVLRAFA